MSNGAREVGGDQSWHAWDDKGASEFGRLAVDHFCNNLQMEGVSVENRQHGLPRIELLRQSPAKVRFLSVEPLLEHLGTLNLEGINWVIVGGESGPGARPMEAAWVRSIRAQCSAESVAFFFKQWGGVRKSSTGRSLDGRTYSEFPERVRNEAPAREVRRERLERMESGLA